MRKPPIRKTIHFTEHQVEVMEALKVLLETRLGVKVPYPQALIIAAAKYIKDQEA